MQFLLYCTHAYIRDVSEWRTSRIELYLHLEITGLSDKEFVV